MTTSLRVRLDFDASLSLSELQQSWLALPDSLACMSDLYGFIMRTYSLRKQARSPDLKSHGLRLSASRVCVPRAAAHH